MPPISRVRFAWYLRRLSADEFAAFVGDLWAARGWSTEVRDDVVVATREEPASDRNAIFVRHAAPLFGSVDGTPGRGGLTHLVTSGPGSDDAHSAATALGADLVHRGDLYDAAVYALDPATREDVFQRHFGRSATTPDRAEVLGRSVSRLSSRSGALLALVIVFVIAAAAVGGAPFLDDGTSPNDSAPDAGVVATVDTATPAPFDAPASAPTIAADSEPTATPRETPSPASGPQRVSDPPDVVPGSGGTAWDTFRGDVARSGHRPDAVGPVADVAVLGIFSADGPVGSSPAVVNGTVYVGSAEGTLYALKALTLSVDWDRALAGPIVSSPAVTDGTIYVGSAVSNAPGASFDARSEHRTLAVDASDGGVEWRAPTGSVTISSPAVVNDTAYVGSTNGDVYALDVHDGSVRWNASTNASVVSSPSASDGVVYVGSTDGAVYAFDADTGSIRWTTETNGSVFATPAVVDDAVYVGSGDGRMYAIDADDGSVRWHYDTGEMIVSSAAVTDDAVYVGSGNGVFYALDAETGDERWTHPTNGSVVASPAVANGTVYLGSNDGHVYAVDAETGDERWSFFVGSPVHSSPAVVDGIVYVGTNGGHVFALAEGDSA